MSLPRLPSAFLASLLGGCALLTGASCGAADEEMGAEIAEEIVEFEDAGDGVEDESDLQAAASTAPDLGPVVRRIAETVEGFSPGTQVALSVSWLPSGQRWSYHGNQAHVAASSAKFVWADAALRYHSDTDDEIAQVKRYALPTFRISDNSAAGRLIDYAGGPNMVNHFTHTLLDIPITSLSLCRWNIDKQRLATNCSSRMDGNNFLTPNASVEFLRSVWEGRRLTAANRKRLLYWATLSPRSGTGGWLGAQLPAKAKKTMRHKAGWLPPGTTTSEDAFAVMNDIGIVTTPKGPYAVALLYAHGRDYWGKQRRALEWSSCVIYHALAEDVDDPFQAGCKR